MTDYRFGNLGTARRYGLSRIYATQTGFRWRCPGCGNAVLAGGRVYETSRGVWRCLDCASPKVDL